MKPIRSILLAVGLLLTAPLFALDPHYAGSITNQSLSFNSATAGETDNLAQLSPNTVNSGTNSFYIQANLKFDAPDGFAVHVQISKTVSSTTTIFSDTVQNITGPGYLSITTEQENIAASTTIQVQVLFDVAGSRCGFGRVTLSAIGLAGSTVMNDSRDSPDSFFAWVQDSRFARREDV